MPTCPFANSMAKIKKVSKSSVGAASARGWQPQPGKPPSLNFREGFEEWSRWRRGPTLFLEGLKTPSFHFVALSPSKFAWTKPYFYVVRENFYITS